MVWVWSFLGFLLRWAWVDVAGPKARANVMKTATVQMRCCIVFMAAKVG